VQIKARSELALNISLIQTKIMSKYQKQTKHTPISASDLVTHYDRLVSKIEILVSFEHIKLKAHIQFIAWQGHNCPQKREQY
jgi:hypothetical protein